MNAVSMADSITIGLIQRETIPHDPAGNLLSTLEMMDKCTAQEVDLFVLPELWATGLIDPTESSSLSLAENIDGPTIESLSEFCRINQVGLLAGTLALRDAAGLKNTSLLIDRSGEIVLKYSKIHLFSAMGEDMIYEPGTSLSAAEINGIGIGVVICYDLRFPSLVRKLAESGCEVILVPAMWPEVRINHWETLLRARAIENQVFMVGANGLANQHGFFFPGHSMIVGPAGEALNSPEMRESVIVRKLDMRQLRRLRRDTCYLDEEIEAPEVNWNVRVNEPGSTTV